jgi:hypothetical protein
VRLAAQLVLAMLLPLSLGACAAEPTPADATLSLGTGTSRFVALADGDEVPMIHGAQGGWHVWVSVRVEGMDVGTGSLTIEHQPADESEPMIESRVGVLFDPPDAEGGRVSLGWPAIFSDPQCSVGRLHRIRVTLTTASGERLTAEREVVPAGGEFPPPPCGIPLPPERG